MMTTETALIGRAEAIFNEILTNAEETAGGEMGWVEVRPDPFADRLLIDSSDGLYRGRLGISLFSAALFRVTGTERYRETATKIVDSVTSNANTASNHDRSVGLDQGIASRVYSLTKIAELLDENRYLKRARNEAQAFSDVSLEAKESDLLEGLSGVLVALLRCYERTDDAWLLEQAIRCGDILLNRTETTGNYRSIPTVDDIATPGFAHGQAGIARALVELSRASGDSTYERCARSLLMFESELYSEYHSDWPGIVSDGVKFVDGWCHGGTGIGIGRLAITTGGDFADEAAIDIERALHDVEFSPGRSDCLCHGNAGHASLLLTAASVLDDDSYKRNAQMILDRIESRSEMTGSYRFPLSEFNEPYAPSLFVGTAGIGYINLRAAKPSVVPNILAFA